MALPTLDAVFASAADQPRRYMLAQWLVEEKGETQGSSSVLVAAAGSESANGIYNETSEVNGKKYYNLSGDISDTLAISWDGSSWIIWGATANEIYISTDDVEFPWQVTTWTLDQGESPVPTVTEIPASNPVANYITLPERYLWAKIAVAAGAPRGEADYISLPKNYVWSDIYNAVAGLIPPSSVLVSGAGSGVNGTYTERGTNNGKKYYSLVGQPDNTDQFAIYWEGTEWEIFRDATLEYYAAEDVEFPWQVTTWEVFEGIEPFPFVTEIPQLTPNHTDWSEKQALGHIAAAYRGDTGNPANLATYIDWPWRYQVASIITAL